MQTYLKTKPAWIQLWLFLGMAFGLFLIATFIALPILSKMTGIAAIELQDSRKWDLNNPQIMVYVRGLILVQFLFLFSIPALLFSYFSDPQPTQYLGLSKPSKSLYWIFSILLMIVAYPFVEYIGYWNQQVHIGGSIGAWLKGMEEEANRQIVAMLKTHTIAELIKNLIFVSLFAGIGEELFFRGILQRIFIRLTKSPWLGIIVTAAIFSGIHFQFYGFFPRFLLGVLLGAIYWYSGSLWVAMLCHFLYDAIVIVYLYFHPELLANKEATILQGQHLTLLIGAVISLGLTFLILKRMQKSSVANFDAIYHDDFPRDPNQLSF